MNIETKMILDKIFEESNLNNTKNIYIFSHRMHDVDAKCSALALVQFFKYKGFNSKYIITKEDFLLTDTFGKVEVTEEISKEKFVAVCVDTATKAILENNFCFNARKIFKIDHHKDGENYADYSLIMEHVSSTCEILSMLIPEKYIKDNIATLLYAGIRSDTGGFSYSTSANTFSEVVKLILKGANHLYINRVLNTVALKRKKIEALVNTHAKFFSKDLLGAIIYDSKDFKALSLARAVNGLTNVKAKVFFVIAKSNTEDTFFEIRSATTCDIDVSIISKKYGGGGHFHASGFSKKNVTNKFIYEFIDELKEMLL